MARTRIGWEQVLAFLPRFRAEGFTTQVDDRMAMPWNRRPNPVDEFVQCLKEAGVLHSFHWPTWMNERGQNLASEPEELSRASLEDVARLLTSLVMQDRYQEGRLAAAFEDGLVVRALERVEAALAEPEAETEADLTALAERQVGQATVVAVADDLTTLEVDAVVNAANVHLQHSGGVAGALSRAAGPSLQSESNSWVTRNGPLEPGTAAVTSAGTLPSRWVVHVAGPVYGSGVPDDETHLRSTVAAALTAASDAGASSVALPAISAGIYGYPPEEATMLIASEVVRILPETELRRVLLVGLDEETAMLFALGLRAA